MPTVGMRRITRVFGARVLRSGRRLCIEPPKEGKHVRAANGGNEWVELLGKNSAGGGAVAVGHFKNVRPEKNRVVVGVNVSPTRKQSSLEVNNIVYRRKKRRAELTSGGLSEDKRFGKKFARRNVKDLKSTAEAPRAPRNAKELKSTCDACFTSCAANVLIIEPDKCYREEGAVVTLERSDSKKWSLAVMKDGMKRYSLAAEKIMRPSSSNRVTHATVWTGISGWKLEFTNKQDWVIFKELYKKCYERNVEAPPTSVIPVPRVQEVHTPIDSFYTPYVRPDSYINVEDDELTRALVKRSANYDMDSDDEKWMTEFNDEFYAITPEIFELVIDTLEKGFHCNPDDYCEEQAAAAYVSSIHLERKAVIEAICNYWIKKRKQKRAALVRIFQLYQPKKAQVIPKSVLRKKRSFRRHSIHCQRSEQRTFLQAAVAAQDPLERLDRLHKVQEAKSTADRSVVKRKRAQILMQNADLATYKAMRALRIAEAAQVTNFPGTLSSLFLG